LLISICIPAFKRTDFLKRLLDSIAVQTFRDYEVVLSDDSPGEEVRDFTRHYEGMSRRWVRLQTGTRPSAWLPANGSN
jgi:GT2 family glycosyltransferase